MTGNMDLADMPQLLGVWGLEKPGQVVHVWTFGRRAKQVNQQVKVSPGEGGQEEEEAPASHWGGGVSLKPSEASTHLEPWACPIILSWELDVHRIGNENREAPISEKMGCRASGQGWSLSTSTPYGLFLSLSLSSLKLSLPLLS